MKMRFFVEQTYIAAGALLIALGVNVFLLPCKLSSGGVTSIGTMLLYLFDIRLSVTNIVANAVLFVLGYKFLGKTAVVRTFFGIVYLSLFFEITSSFSFGTDNIFLAAVSGGILTGCGIGSVIRADASTGGSDFLSLIVKRFFPHISVSDIILTTDGLIIALSGIVFKSFEITFFSLISLFTAYKMTDMILSFGKKAKSIQIFSEKYAEIAAAVIDERKRGVSAFYCKGMYTKKNGNMLLCIVSAKEVPSFVRMIKNVDGSAFVVISEVTEVFGKGF